MDTIADRDLLTEGSVWVRDNGKQNIVLLITNRALNARTQKNHPPQVVYTDEKGNVFNQTVAAFLKTRTFLNVNPTMETRCLGLTLHMFEDEVSDELDVLAVAEDDEEESEEALPLADEPEDDSVIARFMAGTSDSSNVDLAEQASAEEAIIATASHTAVAAQDAEVPQPAVTFFAMNDSALPVVLTPEFLSEALVSYEVAPNLERGMMIHTLAFECEDLEMANKIFKSFHAKHYEENAVYGFNVNSATGNDQVSWTASLGVFPYIVNDQNFVRVMVMTQSPVPVELPEESAEAESTYSAPEVQEEAPADLLERVEAVLQNDAQPLLQQQ